MIQCHIEDIMPFSVLNTYSGNVYYFYIISDQNIIDNNTLSEDFIDFCLDFYKINNVSILNIIPLINAEPMLKIYFKEIVSDSKIYVC